MGKASPWSIEGLNKRFHTGIIKSKAAYQSRLAGLVNTEKLDLLEVRMKEQEDLSATQKDINNEIYSKLNKLESTRVIIDKHPSEMVELTTWWSWTWLLMLRRRLLRRYA